MENIKTVKDLVDFWPTRQKLADALSRDGDIVPVTRIHRWVALNTIKAMYFHAIIIECNKIGFKITADDLVRIHHQPKETTP